MSGIQYGFVAQEVEKIFPSIVTTEESGYKAVSYISIIPMLVQSFQEQKLSLDKSESEINSLNNKIDVLKKESSDLSLRLRTVTGENEFLKQQFDRLTVTIEGHNSLKQENKELTSRYASLLDDHTKLKSENKKIQEQLTELRKENSEFKLTVLEELKQLKDQRYAKK